MTIGTPLHVCVATGENLANLLPVLQLGAAEVLVLATPRMERQAAVLRRFLQARKIRVRVAPFDDASPEALDAAAQQVAAELSGRHVVLNAGGGTKLMALTLVEAVRGLGHEGGAMAEIVYPDTDHDRIVWIAPKGHPAAPMADLLNLEDILAAQGYVMVGADSNKPDWRRVADRRAALTRRLAAEFPDIKGFLAALNRLAQSALDDRGEMLKAPRQVFEYSPGPREADFLRQACDAATIEWDGELALTFREAQAARYFAGHWLEEHVYLELAAVNVHDWAVGVHVKTLNESTRNEFDALVAHRNRLLVIECKTATFGSDGDAGSRAIYKIDSLARRAGGLMHERLLLSARELGDAPSRRAAETRVRVLEGPDVALFPRFVEAWTNGDLDDKFPLPAYLGRGPSNLMNRKEKNRQAV